MGDKPRVTICPLHSIHSGDLWCYCVNGKPSIVSDPGLIDGRPNDQKDCEWWVESPRASGCSVRIGVMTSALDVLQDMVLEKLIKEVKIIKDKLKDVDETLAQGPKLGER